MHVILLLQRQHLIRMTPAGFALSVRRRAQRRTYRNLCNLCIIKPLLRIIAAPSEIYRDLGGHDPHLKHFKCSAGFKDSLGGPWSCLPLWRGLERKKSGQARSGQRCLSLISVDSRLDSISSSVCLVEC